MQKQEGRKARTEVLPMEANERIQSVHSSELTVLFGHRVRALRKAVHLTIEEASEGANISSKFYGEIERGKKRPSFDTILAIADALQVPPVLFFHFDPQQVTPTELRQRIYAIVDGCIPQQLNTAYRVLCAVVQP
jgi:transcriptional regulator with XRE-family HTH domain